MLDWTDRHCRYFHRLISPEARLYTEMLTTGAFDPRPDDALSGLQRAGHPVALQLAVASSLTWRTAPSWRRNGATTRSIELRLPQRARAARCLCACLMNEATLWQIASRP